MDRRGDIDGLRAIAVLGVVLFHIDPHWAPGGFVGVDIFFVISGYLITSIIAKQIQDGTFSLAHFYERRIKRIFPALAIVVLTTLIVGHFVLLPGHLDELSNSAVASILFSANIFFTYYVDTGYFADGSATKPLLHLWSLGVEEQFYLLWPLAMMALLTPARSVRGLAVLLAALVVVGIGVSEWLTSSSPTFAYYMLPSRAFELLMGATLAFARLPRTAWITNAMAASGIVLILGSMALLTEQSPFPGFNAVPATLGAALVIAGGTHVRPVASRLLATAPLVGVGLISYSLYLWHWPVMAFLRYAYVTVTLAVGLVALALMLALAARPDLSLYRGSRQTEPPDIPGRRGPHVSCPQRCHHRSRRDDRLVRWLRAVQHEDL